jgi:SAM-dependent methyltransferase
LPSAEAPARALNRWISGGKMRLEGKVKLGFYPLPVTEAGRIRRFLRYPENSCATIDPCIGDGTAFAAITGEAPALRYGIELDAYRAEQARARAHEVIHGSAFDVHCSVESVSLLYLNPPYDFEWGQDHKGRMERVFLEQLYRWLKPGGVLVFVLPGQRLCTCDRLLATHFRDKRVYRLSAPDAAKYGQVVVFGVRRSRRERDRLGDSELIRARDLINEMSRKWNELRALPDEPNAVYPIPESGPLKLVYNGLPLDEIEDLLPNSPAYRQASRILFAPPKKVEGRPLTPLHAGHVALLAVSSMLDGTLGSGEKRHIAAWRCIKVTDCSEEVEADGTIIQSERERFTNELTLVYASGKTAVLR